MADDVQLQVVSVPMLDTGIGREAGFRDDAELIAVAEAERAAMTPLERALLDRLDVALERAVLGG